MILKRHCLNASCAVLLLCAICALSQDPAPPRRRGGRSPQTTTNAPPPAVAMKVAAPQLVDYTDPAYGSKIRQLRKDDGHEHNFYYYRDPWNADGSRLLGIQSDLNQKNWHVVLYDGDGKFIKDLFPINQFDWRLCWDRNAPDILYTWRGYDLHRFNVNTGEAKLLKSFQPLPISTAGPSVNQTGDRLVISTSDHTFHSYRLPDLGDERTFKPEIPAGCFVSWDKPRYTGWRNTIDVAYKSADLKQTGILLYDDTGRLVHHFKGIGGGGHYAFSCDGRLAYFLMPNYPRTDGKNSLDIHVVDADGSNDRVLYSAPREKAVFVQNLHVSWPGRVGDWFVASFFHHPNLKPQTYAPPLDEILQLRLDGTCKFLARTGSEYSRGAGRGSSTDLFWAMPLAVPSADGKRICFNSNRSGTVDQHILYVEAGGK
ncbi:MAG: PD40 domain-containing protein [Verrucomicrobia bacterium]|nr:PD40 domain-containing protein [Verrucomicrobiota bacterium]